MEKLLEEFSLGLFVWQTLLFVGLLLLLKKYAWGPILSAVNEREEGIKNALSAADNAKKEMENLQADNQKLLKEARAEREAMLKEARELKNSIIESAKTEAKEEASKLIANAEAAIESEKKAAIADLKSVVAELSISIAETVVREELSDPSKQEKLVESMLKDATLN